MITKSTNNLKKMWLFCCFVLLSLTMFAQQHAAITLRNFQSTSTTFSYDLYVLNDGTLPLKLAGFSTGVTFSGSILGAGASTSTSLYSFTRDAAISALAQNPAYTVGKLHLRSTGGVVGEGVAVTIPTTGQGLKLGTCTFTQTVPWVSSSNPALALQMLPGSGVTQFILTCFVNGSTSGTSNLKQDAVGGATLSGTIEGAPFSLNSCAASSSTTTTSACESYVWSRSGTASDSTITTSGTYVYHLLNNCGSDSTVTLNITINHGTHNSESQTACETYTWHGIAHTSTGTYIYTYTNISDCASADTLHLTINHGTFTSDTQTACETYTFHSTAYTTSGTYVYTYTNGSSCASADTLHLTINHGTFGSSTQSSCVPVVFHGITHSSTGTYVYTYTNGSDCPSADTLHLTITNSTTASETVSECVSYVWHGTTYTTSGDYTFDTTNSNGCAHTITLHLTIKAASSSSTPVTVCTSALPYSWNSNSYASAGTYVVHLTNVAGCDSAATLVLTVQDYSVDTIVGPKGACAYASTTPGTSSNVATYSVAATAASDYFWTVPAGAILRSGQHSNTITVAFINTYTTGSITVAVTNACGGTSLTKSQLVTKGAPVLGAISGPSNACSYIGTSTQITYSIAAVANAITYRWTIPAGLTLVSAASDSLSVTVTVNSNFASLLAADRTIKVKAISGCGNTADKTFAIGITAPGTPTSLTGPNNACFYMTTEVATYVTKKVANATDYIWTLPAGGTILSHPGGEGTANDTIITVQYDSASFVSGNLSVQSHSPCGTSLPKSMLIKSVMPANAGVFLANPTNSDPTKPVTDVCTQLMAGSVNSEGTPIEYKIRKVTGATSYIWDVYSVVGLNHVTTGIVSVTHPAGEGVNDTVIVVLFDSSLAKTNTTISVKAANPCFPLGSGEKKLLVKPVMSATPGTISGPVDACTAVAQGTDLTYTIRKVALATSYDWSVITGGVPSTSASVTSHPGGAGTANDTIVTIHFDQTFVGGSVQVRSIRNCGISVGKTLAVSTKKIGQTSVIRGPLVVCVGSTVTYSCAPVANANAYTWSFPATAGSIVHPNGTGVNDTIVTVTYASVLPAAVGKVGVQAQSLCLGAGAKTVSITRGACRMEAARGTMVAGGESFGGKLDVSVYPNPSRGNFNIAINSSDKVSAAQVEITNEYGQSVYRRSATNNSGVVALAVNNNLSNGIYMITVTVGTEKITKRLVINR